MKDFLIENLFCCPICKKSLVRESQNVICDFCGEKFSKEGDVYNFRIKSNNFNKDKINRLGQLILDSDSEWFTNIFRYISQAEYEKALIDPHLKEIDEYMDKFLEKGIDIGKRYNTNILPKGSIRDLHELSIALRYIPKMEERNIALDLGCGTLRVTKELLNRGFKKIIAMDLLSGMMSYGYSQLNNEEKNKVVLVKADVRFLPIKDHSTNLVFALELFEHVDNPLLFLLDAKRVLKKDGVAVMNTWNALGVLNRKIIKQKGISYYENGFFYKFYTIKDLKILLRKINVLFSLKPYGCYLGRRLLNILGDNFGKFFFKPVVFIDNLLSSFLPQFLFPFLIFSFSKTK